MAKSRRGAAASHVHLVNAYTVSLAAADPAYAQLLTAGSINLPDGKPIALLSRLRRQTPRLHQVRGPQLFLDVFDVGRQYELRHFLLGSSPEVLVRLSNALNASYPGCEIVGTESPAFRPLSDSELAEQDRRIRATKPDIIWVGLGTPKQDWEAQRLVSTLGITSVAIGAAFDFASGTVKEAPLWIRNIGCEWLFRLCVQPRRLWRRYLIGNCKFIRVALGDISDNGWRPGPR
ncbi:WecB/TagA/CpsF family glycosyltransferase [Arthrobacter sp. KBS0703]|uniref:WecB/TagA/CpsF family glycosyltransferase n=1 Tax=Arthrobacter sp. KBS0703 TaxID=1955698 RepID=UPI0037C12238